MVIPTLEGGPRLARCLRHLAAQTFSDFETVVIDNAAGRARVATPSADSVRWIVNSRNVGFGEAINQGAAAAPDADYVLALNDDAYPSAGWLAALVEAAEADPRVGMCASRIVLAASPDKLDSAGLGIYLDGTTKQIGHGRPASEFDAPREALLPSGCAALYRRRMLDDIGGFDNDYFLYGEDSDVGLRGRLAGWTCRYVPAARVAHDYSGSAGRASRLKAFHVERNRLWTVLKTFPLALLPLAPLAAAWRYLAHLRAAAGGRGLAGGVEGGTVAAVVILWSAHWRTLLRLPELWRKRRLARRGTRLGLGEFRRLLREHAVSAREIAEQ